MGSKVDDIFFATARVAGKSGDEVAGSFIDAAARGRFDPTSMFKSMTSSSYYENFKIPDVPLKTSNLFHSPDFLVNLKRVDVKDLVPDSTADVLTTMSKSIDNVPTGAIDDLAATLKKVDLDNATAVADAARKSSLGKLKDISDQVANQAKKNADLLGTKGVNGNLDNALDARKINSLDEMTDALKDSAAKKLSKQTDEIAGASSDIAKKADLGTLDDAARQAKNADILDALAFAKKYDGKLSVGIVASFMAVEYLNNRVNAGAELDDFVYDPGALDANAAIEEADIDGELTILDEDSDGVLASNTALVGAIALGAAAFVL